jgi:DNA-directed RNA polymerase subunit RPC12/RpoP
MIYKCTACGHENWIANRPTPTQQQQQQQPQPKKDGE